MKAIALKWTFVLSKECIISFLNLGQAPLQLITQLTLMSLFSSTTPAKLMVAAKDKIRTTNKINLYLLELLLKKPQTQTIERNGGILQISQHNQNHRQNYPKNVLIYKMLSIQYAKCQSHQVEINENTRQQNSFPIDANLIISFQEGKRVKDEQSSHKLIVCGACEYSIAVS
eukprot:TRINITY_DN8699_c0_g1_i1.p2 TRINITY_DN8699_c0_g1~~TRINITY_DN8699_c0_g1_i1.p2  ORF type:complete len:172 (-),score=0.12 TRINITY_DN8699_c0_g1_i1:438-953(-)